MKIHRFTLLATLLTSPAFAQAPAHLTYYTPDNAAIIGNNNANWDSSIRINQDAHSFWVGGSHHMWIRSNGNVGIGTSTPLAPLQVGDGTDTSSMTGVAGSIRATSHSFSTGISARRDGYAEVGMRAGPMGEIGNFTNHPVALITNATERME